VVAKFGNAAATVPLPWVLSEEGARVLVGSERRWGEKSVHGDGGDRVTELITIVDV
jgi:hypothetical protein